MQHNKNLTDLAQELRRNMTKEEKQLWYRYLREYPVQFRRQVTCGNYIMDFSKFDSMINEAELAKQLEEAKNNAPQTDKQVPAGNYTVKIEKMELGATKDGRPMFKVQCRILEGEFKKWCIFLNRVIYGTKNDASMISSVIGWLQKLEPSVPVEFKNYSQFSDLVLDIFEEVADAVELDVYYDPDAFNSISIEEVFDAE